MDVLLALVVLAMPLLALGVVIGPPVAFAVRRRRVVPAVLLYVAALGMIVAWAAAADADLEWADRTGGRGNAFAGAAWLLGAVVAAAGAITATLRRGPTVSSG